MWRYSKSSTLRIASIATWPDEVAPAVPTEISLPRSISASSRSGKVSNGVSGLTLITGTFTTVL
jgi:hypothetical protein